MDPLLIVIGVLLIIVSIIAVILACVDLDGALFFVGAAAIVGAAGGFLLDKGWHGENAKFAAKHAEIVSDLQSQGIAVASSNVNARGGWYYNGTEADIKVGACLMPFIAVRAGGQWRLALLNAVSGADAPTVRLIDRTSLDRLAEGCAG